MPKLLKLLLLITLFLPLSIPIQLTATDSTNNNSDDDSIQNTITTYNYGGVVIRRTTDAISNNHTPASNIVNNIANIANIADPDHNTDEEEAINSETYNSENNDSDSSESDGDTTITYSNSGVTVTRSMNDYQPTADQIMFFFDTAIINEERGDIKNAQINFRKIPLKQSIILLMEYRFNYIDKFRVIDDYNTLIKDYILGQKLWSETDENRKLQVIAAFLINNIITEEDIKKIRILSDKVKIDTHNIINIVDAIGEFGLNSSEKLSALVLLVHKYILNNENNITNDSAINIAMNIINTIGSSNRFNDAFGLISLTRILENVHDINTAINIIKMLDNTKISFYTISKHKNIESLLSDRNIYHSYYLDLVDAIISCEDSTLSAKLIDIVNITRLYYHPCAREKLYRLNIEKLQQITPKTLPPVDSNQIPDNEVIKRYQKVIAHFGEEMIKLSNSEAEGLSEMETTNNTFMKVLKNLFEDPDEQIKLGIPEKNKKSLINALKNILIKFEELLNQSNNNNHQDNDDKKDMLLAHLSSLLRGFQYCSSRQVEEVENIVAVLIKQQETATGYLGKLYQMINDLKLNAFYMMIQYTPLTELLHDSHNANIVSMIRSIIKNEIGLPGAMGEFSEYIREQTVNDVADFASLYIDKFFNEEIIVNHLLNQIKGNDNDTQQFRGLYLSFLSDSEKLKITSYDEFFGPTVTKEQVTKLLENMHILNPR